MSNSEKDKQSYALHSLSSTCSSMIVDKEHRSTSLPTPVNHHFTQTSNPQLHPSISLFNSNFANFTFSVDEDIHAVDPLLVTAHNNINPAISRCQDTNSQAHHQSATKMSYSGTVIAGSNRLIKPPLVSSLLPPESIVVNDQHDSSSPPISSPTMTPITALSQQKQINVLHQQQPIKKKHVSNYVDIGWPVLSSTSSKEHMMSTACQASSIPASIVLNRTRSRSNTDLHHLVAIPNTPAIHAASPISPNSIDKRIILYKTELCRTLEETGTCRYGSRCQFAHSPAELRPIPRHPRYKTEICTTFWTKGKCPYGKRCCFIHTEQEAQRVGLTTKHLVKPPGMDDSLKEDEANAIGVILTNPHQPQVQPFHYSSLSVSSSIQSIDAMLSSSIPRYKKSLGISLHPSIFSHSSTPVMSLAVGSSVIIKQPSSSSLRTVTLASNSGHLSSAVATKTSTPIIGHKSTPSSSEQDLTLLPRDMLKLIDFL